MRRAKLAPDKMMLTAPSVRPWLTAASVPRGGGREPPTAWGAWGGLVDVGLLAERVGREHLRLVAAVGAPFDLVAGPHRVFVKRFRYLVDMGPLELGLRSG